MKYLTKIINSFLRPHPKKPMGRWAVESCEKKTNNRVDLSNEDHCGPCGHYILTKTQPEKAEPKKTGIVK